MNHRSLRAIGCGFVVALALAPLVGASDKPRANNATTRPVVVQVHGNDFHWSDAAVGAATTIGLLLAGVGIRIAHAEFHQNGKGRK